MRAVEPSVSLLARTTIDPAGLEDYLSEVGGMEWLDRVGPTASSDAELLVEAAGRTCYRAWAPGLNPNVTKVRTDSEAYLSNILQSGHGSVTEHASFTFALHNVSRVVTHELCRHRAGVAISQESMRYVRLTDIPMWAPAWAQQDPELVARNRALLDHMESHQRWMAKHFDLDGEGVPFSVKKHKTSYMRRFAPDGVATSIVWTANVRALRHVIEMRTDPSAEEEIRLVFDLVAEVMTKEAPYLFGDFERHDDGAWVPQNRKV